MALDAKQKKGMARVLILLGAAAAIGGVVALVYAMGASRELSLLEASVPASPADLAAGGELAGQVVRVRGIARGPGAEVSEVDGVAYLFAEERVEHHYERARSTASRSARRSHRTLWSWEHAVDFFTVEWGGAAVPVLGKPIVEVTPETRAPENRQGTLRFGDLSLPAPPIRAHERIELERRNIRDGAEVVVVGVARPTDEGGLALAPDDNGTLLVSTLSDQALAHRLSSRENIALIFFGAGAVVGLGLIVAGIAVHPRGGADRDAAAPPVAAPGA